MMYGSSYMFRHYIATLLFTKFIGLANVSGGLMRINQYWGNFSFLRRKVWYGIVGSLAVPAHSSLPENV
jgi:hypothetical protein